MRAGLFILVCAVLVTACGGTDEVASRGGQCWLEPSSNSCSRTVQTNGWTFTLMQDEDAGNGYFELEVTAPEGFGADQLLTVWEGEAMYMGKFPLPLTFSGGRHWSGLVALPVCSVDPGMNWIMKLQSEAGPIQLDRPLVLGAQPKNDDTLE